MKVFSTRCINKGDESILNKMYPQEVKEGSSTKDEDERQMQPKVYNFTRTYTKKLKSTFVSENFLYKIKSELALVHK